MAENKWVSRSFFFSSPTDHWWWSPSWVKPATIMCMAPFFFGLAWISDTSSPWAFGRVFFLPLPQPPNVPWAPWHAEKCRRYGWYHQLAQWDGSGCSYHDATWWFFFSKTSELWWRTFCVMETFIKQPKDGGGLGQDLIWQKFGGLWWIPSWTLI